MTELADHHIAKNDAAALLRGAIWVSTYGYEACLASWYVVTRSTDKSIWLADIQSVETGNWEAGTSSPLLPVVKIGPERRYAIRDKSYGLRVRRNSYSSIHPWGGSPINTYNHH